MKNVWKKTISLTLAFAILFTGMLFAPQAASTAEAASAYYLPSAYQNMVFYCVPDDLPATYVTQKVISGAKAARPKKPKRSKYIFDGWYTTKNGKTKYNFGKAVTGNITVYAKWKKVTVGKASISKLENKSGKKMKVTFDGAADYISVTMYHGKTKSYITLDWNCMKE